ncbi:hypothetical protein BKI52_15340 [marine bacterium AO1-C]|nr:hypothetical protein BKI52_15340 [marine bacterium AO1-C]
MPQGMQNQSNDQSGSQKQNNQQTNNKPGNYKAKQKKVIKKKNKPVFKKNNKAPIPTRHPSIKPGKITNPQQAQYEQLMDLFTQMETLMPNVSFDILQEYLIFNNPKVPDTNEMLDAITSKKKKSKKKNATVNEVKEDIKLDNIPTPPLNIPQVNKSIKNKPSNWNLDGYDQEDIALLKYFLQTESLRNSKKYDHGDEKVILDDFYQSGKDQEYLKKIKNTKPKGGSLTPDQNLPQDYITDEELAQQIMLFSKFASQKGKRQESKQDIELGNSSPNLLNTPINQGLPPAKNLLDDTLDPGGIIADLDGDLMDKQYDNYSQIGEQTIQQLYQSLQTKADWHTIELADSQRSTLGRMMELLNNPAVAATCGNFKAKNLLRKLVTYANPEKEIIEPLQEYVRVASTQYPFRLETVNNLEDALDVGNRLQLIQQALPVWMIHNKLDNDNFKKFKAKDIKNLHDYRKYAKLPPFFQSREDFKGFKNLSVDKGITPLRFEQKGLKNRIRNFHRFEYDALIQLEKNYEYQGKDKPLTLILHSSIDHDGAFTNDAYLTQLIKNRALLTLMIEGKTNLGAFSGLISQIAKKYGRNGKIDQVMFAGHGSANSIELAGDIEENDKIPGTNQYKDNKSIKERQQGDMIDFKNNKKASEDLFKEVLKNMNVNLGNNKDKYARILFNACLTNATEITLKHWHSYLPNPTNDKSIADENSLTYLRNSEIFKDLIGADYNLSTVLFKMKDWVAKNKNLVQHVEQLAQESKANDVEVVGSIAAHQALKLFDNENKLTLESKLDPLLVTKDKLEYLEHGAEPQGAIMALAYAWTQIDTNDDLKKVVDTIERVAVKTDATHWGKSIIYALMSFLKETDTKYNFYRINSLRQLAYQLLHLRFDNTGSSAADIASALLFVNGHLGINANNLKFIANKLKATNIWIGNPYVALRFYQGHINVGVTSMIADLMNSIKLDTVNLAYLTNPSNFNLSMVKSELLNTTYGNAALKVALALLHKGVNKDIAINYLKNHHIENNKFKPGDEVEINGIIAGVTTKEALLDLMTADNKPKPENDKPLAAPQNNVTLEGGKEHMRITPYNNVALVNNHAPVYRKPNAGSIKLSKVLAKQKVNVIGHSGEFYAIQHKQGDKMTTAFVHSAYLDNIPKLGSGKIKALNKVEVKNDKAKINEAEQDDDVAELPNDIPNIQKLNLKVKAKKPIMGIGSPFAYKGGGDIIAKAGDTVHIIGKVDYVKKADSKVGQDETRKLFLVNHVIFEFATLKYVFREDLY